MNQKCVWLLYRHKKTSPIKFRFLWGVISRIESCHQQYPNPLIILQMLDEWLLTFLGHEPLRKYDENHSPSEKVQKQKYANVRCQKVQRVQKQKHGSQGHQWNAGESPASGEVARLAHERTGMRPGCTGRCSGGQRIVTGRFWVLGLLSTILHDRTSNNCFQMWNITALKKQSSNNC